MVVLRCRSRLAWTLSLPLKNRSCNSKLSGRQRVSLHLRQHHFAVQRPRDEQLRQQHHIQPLQQHLRKLQQQLYKQHRQPACDLHHRLQLQQFLKRDQPPVTQTVAVSLQHDRRQQHLGLLLLQRHRLQRQPLCARWTGGCYANARTILYLLAPKKQKCKKWEKGGGTDFFYASKAGTAHMCCDTCCISIKGASSSTGGRCDSEQHRAELARTAQVYGRPSSFCSATGSSSVGCAPNDNTGRTFTDDIGGVPTSYTSTLPSRSSSNHHPRYSTTSCEYVAIGIRGRKHRFTLHQTGQVLRRCERAVRSDICSGTDNSVRRGSNASSSPSFRTYTLAGYNSGSIDRSTRFLWCTKTGATNTVHICSNRSLRSRSGRRTSANNSSRHSGTEHSGSTEDGQRPGRSSCENSGDSYSRSKGWFGRFSVAGDLCGLGVYRWFSFLSTRYSSAWTNNSSGASRGLSGFHSSYNDTEGIRVRMIRTNTYSLRPGAGSTCVIWESRYKSPPRTCSSYRDGNSSGYDCSSAVGGAVGLHTLRTRVTLFVRRRCGSGSWSCSCGSWKKSDEAAKHFMLTDNLNIGPSSIDGKLTKLRTAPVGDSSGEAGDSVCNPTLEAAAPKSSQLHSSSASKKRLGQQRQQACAVCCGSGEANCTFGHRESKAGFGYENKNVTMSFCTSLSPASRFSLTGKQAQICVTALCDIVLRSKSTNTSTLCRSASSTSTSSSSPTSSSTSASRFGLFFLWSLPLCHLLPPSLPSSLRSSSGSPISFSSLCSPLVSPKRFSCYSGNGPRGYRFDPMADATETEPQAIAKLDELAMVQLKTVRLPADLRQRLEQLLLHAGKKKDLERMGRLLMAQYTARTSVEQPRVLPSQLFADARSKCKALKENQQHKTEAAKRHKHVSEEGEEEEESGQRIGEEEESRLCSAEEAMLQQEALALSEEKRHRLFRKLAGSYSPLTAAAYTAHRYTGVYSSLVRILHEIRVRAPDFVPQHVLEMNAGFAAGLAAAARVWAITSSDTYGTCGSFSSADAGVSVAYDNAAEQEDSPAPGQCHADTHPLSLCRSAAMTAAAAWSPSHAYTCNSPLPSSPATLSGQIRQRHSSCSESCMHEWPRSSCTGRGVTDERKQTVFKFLLAVERSPHLANVGKFLTADLSPPVQWQMGLYEEGLVSGTVAEGKKAPATSYRRAKSTGVSTVVTGATENMCEKEHAHQEAAPRCTTIAATAEPQMAPTLGSPPCALGRTVTAASAAKATATSTSDIGEVPGRYRGSAAKEVATTAEGAVIPLVRSCPDMQVSPLGSSSTSGASFGAGHINVVDRRRCFDLIMMPHCLLSSTDGLESMQQQVRLLWNRLARGGVLVLLERGTPTGFRALHAVREVFIRELGVGKFHFIAPCPHESICPLALTGRDWCHFSQRVHRLPHYMYCKGSRAKNVEEEKFSFLAIRKMPGPRTHYAFEAECPTPEERSYFWPRLVMPVIKAGNHCILDLCAAPHGFERVAVSKSMPHTAGYKCARKAAWGDLWRFPRRIIRPDARGYTDEEIRKHLLRLSRTTQSRVKKGVTDLDGKLRWDRSGASGKHELEAELAACFGG